ncbi:MAG: HEAT repeat domain-containing protein [Methanotrichaceae archaeon]
MISFVCQQQAAIALIGINDTRTVEPLIRVLEDNRSHIQSIAAMALGKTKDNRAVGPLIQALKDNNEDVRQEAALALVDIGNRQLLRNTRGTHPDTLQIIITQAN